ncbi:MAG: Ig-like domain-containing protein [Oscillospiraceae bacterium]|nr:Ig-like domain-containing protein [Oscillospiraceae bacterium]
MKKIGKKTVSACLAAMLTFTMGTPCFAGEWKETDKGKMYLDDNGKAVTGIQKIDDQTYYFSSKGIMQSGWLTDKKGNRFYFGSDGIMKTGWLKIKSSRYYLTKNGSAATGVTKIGDNYYCFSNKGRMLTGWQSVNGETYYYESNGKRAVNKTLKIDNKRYRFDSDGNVITSMDAAPSKDPNEVIYPTEISAMTDEIPMIKYTKSYITFKIKPTDANYKEFTYKSSNTDIVEIDKYGEMYAKSRGTCTITVTSQHDSSVKFSVKVKVNEN